LESLEEKASERSGKYNDQTERQHGTVVIPRTNVRTVAKTMTFGTPSALLSSKARATGATRAMEAKAPRGRTYGDRRKTRPERPDKHGDGVGGETHDSENTTVVLIISI
jgi:hypothetical protein